jgi:hypothetical protein
MSDRCVPQTLSQPGHDPVCATSVMPIPYLPLPVVVSGSHPGHLLHRPPAVDDAHERRSFRHERCFGWRESWEVGDYPCADAWEIDPCIERHQSPTPAKADDIHSQPVIEQDLTVQARFAQISAGAIESGPFG